MPCAPAGNTPNGQPGKEGDQIRKTLLAGYVKTHEHKFNEPGFVPPSFVEVFSLKTEPIPKKKADPQHFQMSTPPSTTPITRTLPGFIIKEFPRLESRVPTRQEERAIAQRNQRNAENAEDNARFLFGRSLADLFLLVRVPVVRKYL